MVSSFVSKWYECTLFNRAFLSAFYVIKGSVRLTSVVNIFVYIGLFGCCYKKTELKVMISDYGLSKE